MFLSKLILNVRHSGVRRDLAMPYEMHKTILCKGFDGIDKAAIGRVLFRVDVSEHGPPMLLVQSMREPDWSKLAEGYLKCDAECKVYDPHFEVGQRLRFRLRANPTFKVSSKNEKLGEKHAGEALAQAYRNRTNQMAGAKR